MSILDGLKGHWPVSRRGPEPGRFYGDPAPLARNNMKRGYSVATLVVMIQSIFDGHSQVISTLCHIGTKRGANNFCLQFKSNVFVCNLSQMCHQQDW